MKRSYWQDLKGAFYLIWRNKWSFISVGILLQFVVGIGAAASSWVFQLALLLSGASNIDKRRLFRYSRGIIEMKGRYHETELLAGSEGGLLLNLA